MRTRTRLAVIAIFAVLGLTTGVATAVAAPTKVGTATDLAGDTSDLEMNRDCVDITPNAPAVSALLNPGGIASQIIVTFYNDANNDGATCDGAAEFVGVINPTTPAAALANATHYSTTND